MAAISILSGFSYKGKNYDFDRQGFQTIEAMKNFSDNYLPPLYISTNEEDGQIYLYNASNIPDEITGKWRKIGEGGSADLINYYNKTETNTLLDGKVDKQVGKGLSTNDFTNEDKQKLDDLENYNDTEIRTLITSNTNEITGLKTKVGNAALQTEAQNLSAAINELKNAVDDTTLADRVTATENAIDVLNGDNTVEGSVNKKVAAGLKDAKDYTDEQIELLGSKMAIQCDEMPTYDSTNQEITYIKNGVSTTIPAAMVWFYYVEDNKLKQSILISEEWLTITSAGGINFNEYVSKETDVVDTYTGDEVVTTKIPNIGALQVLQAIIEAELSDKVNVSDVIDSLLSNDSTKPLSANQGKILAGLVNEKLDKTFNGPDDGNKFLGTNNLGEVELKEFDDTLDDTSSNAVQNATLVAAFAAKVDKNFGEDGANKILGTDSNGQVVLLNPSAMGGDAENIAYENEVLVNVDNVKAALDALTAEIYYVAPAISSFTMTPSTAVYEKGQVVTGGVSFAWTTNKPITSQTLTDCVVTPSDRSVAYETDIAANKTFTLTIGDGKKTATASKSISFQDKIYWGESVQPGQYDSDFILSLAGKKLMTSPKGTYSFNAGSGSYCYFAMPQSLKFTSAWVNGFNTDLEVVANAVSFTNASGYTSTYSIVRFYQPSLGSFTAEVK